MLLLLAGRWMPSAHAADWPTYQHDLEHTGRSAAVIDAANLRVSWTAPEGYKTPQIVGNTVYSTKPQGGFSGTGWATHVTAFDLRTGATKWTHSGNYVFSSVAAVGGGLVVFHGGQSCPGCSIPTPAADQLVVLDAATGAIRYQVPLAVQIHDQSGIKMMPLLVPNPADGTVMAYVADGYTIWASRLGPTSGSFLWRQSGQFGGQSIPTLVESSVVLAAGSRFYALDRATGSLNNFHASGAAGGGTTVVYDSTRRQIYILERASQPGTLGSNHALTAFRYVNNAQIEYLWHRVGDGIGRGSVGLGPTGNVYVAGWNPSSDGDPSGRTGTLLELNPETGATLRFILGQFFQQQTPAITAGLLWAQMGEETVAYDLATLEEVRRFPGANSGSWYFSPGAFADDHFIMARGDLVFSKGFQVWAKPTVASSLKHDFNNDGHEDILWQNNSTGQRAVWLMNGSTQAASQYLPEVAVQWVIAGTGDFNGDGWSDIVWENRTTGERALWWMNGTTLVESEYLETAPRSWRIAGTGDFNRDGKLDLLWQNLQSGQRVIWFMEGAVRTGDFSLPTVGVAWQIVATGDFNSDGHVDIVWEQVVTGQRAVWFMDGTTMVSSQSFATVAPQWHIAGAGDFNTDGQLDLVWRKANTAQSAIWYMNGTTRLSGTYLSAVAPIWEIRNR